MSVFDPGSGLLVAGDAVNNTGALTGPNPQFSEDLTTGAASVKKLAALPVRTVLFGHGDPLESGAAAALAALAAR
jgi:glyoxylase-like metal-dependent hydrolase (beta-lactamase superfamily II)